MITAGMWGFSALAAGILAWGYNDAEHPIAAAAIGVLALAWWAAMWRRWLRAPPVLLLAFLGAAALGLGFGISANWAIIAVVATLAAADLHAFRLRVETATNVDPSARLGQRHLARTLIISGAGLALAILSQQLRMHFGVGVALLLGLLAVLGLSRGVSFLRRESD